MEVKKAHCFFEQSGTFKNEFIKLGIPAEDYDIQDNFGETDHVIDLFKEIDDAYDGKSGTVFDNVGGGRHHHCLLPMHLLLCNVPDGILARIHELQEDDCETESGSNSEEKQVA